MNISDTSTSWHEVGRLAVESLWRETAAAWLVAVTCFATLWLA